MKLIKRLIMFVLIIFICIAVFFTKQGYEMYKTALKNTPIETKIKEIKSKEDYTTINNLPEIYKNAVIAVEDHRFYKHGAVDIISIGRAIYVNIISKELVEGGSTITQQLAKNTYFTQDKNIVRKIAETFMAFEFEKKCTKDEIFELYVNTSYFGDGYYCIGKASKGYFNKKPINMNDYESTLLAGVPNAPSIYAPTKNLKLAKERQKQVITKMVKYKYITQKDADKILDNQGYN